MASGAEVNLIIQAGEKLAITGINVRLVSFPSWELFREQSAAYQQSVLPDNIKTRLAVEAGISQGWHEWVGKDGSMIIMEGYGASAPAVDLFRKFGFTVENIIQKAEDLISRGGTSK